MATGSANGNVSLPRYVREVQEFDPVSLLQACAQLSWEIEQAGKNMLFCEEKGYFGKFPITRRALVTSHGLATAARWSIRNHRRNGGKHASRQDVIRLANNATTVEDPFLASDDLLTLLVRLSQEQLPYQESTANLIPRWLTLLTKTHSNDPPLDIGSMFRSRTGLSIEDFITVGMAFYVAASRAPVFPLPQSSSPRLRGVLTEENILRFLALAGADFATFRDDCQAEEREAPGAGRFVFNSLMARPVIRLRDGKFCVPVHRLLIYRITRGIYYDLLDAYSTAEGNPFTDYFGHAFEEYGGLLLKKVFDGTNVFAEPRYGTPERRGPDWTVRRDKNLLTMEFRSGRLPKKVRTQPEAKELMSRIESSLAGTVKRFPGKIQDLRDGSAGLPVYGIERVVAAVVTTEPWWPEPAITNALKDQTNVGDFKYVLMSISDLEWLIRASPLFPADDILYEMLESDAISKVSVKDYLFKKCNRDISRFANHPFDSAFRQLFPGFGGVPSA